MKPIAQKMRRTLVGTRSIIGARWLSACSDRRYGSPGRSEPGVPSAPHLGPPRHRGMVPARVEGPGLPSSRGLAGELASEPLRRLCLAEGRATAATVADHVCPSGDPELFWHGEPQSLCATCHSLYKQSREKGGTKHLQGCDEHGDLRSFEW
jgi:hypothetical protein